MASKVPDERFKSNNLWQKLRIDLDSNGHIAVSNGHKAIDLFLGLILSKIYKKPSLLRQKFLIKLKMKIFVIFTGPK